MLEVKLLGCGGSMPMPNRFLTALMLRRNGHQLLIDCGEGTQLAIRAADMGFKAIDTICFTHYHADHIAGLPGLLLTIGNAARDIPLRIVGPKGLRSVVGALRCIAPELPYEIEYIELDGEQSFQWHDAKLTAFPVNHSISCVGYTVDLPRSRKFDVERAKAKDIPVQYWKTLQAGMPTGGFEPDEVLGKPRKGLKVTYCTDSRPTHSIQQHACESDLFVCEGMYGDEKLQEKAVEKQHMTFKEAATLAEAAHAKRLWLTHFSPSLEDPQAYAEAFPTATIGSDGLGTLLRFEEE